MGVFFPLRSFLAWSDRDPGVVVNKLDRTHDAKTSPMVLPGSVMFGTNEAPMQGVSKNVVYVSTTS